MERGRWTMRKVWKSAAVLVLALVASQLAGAATGATTGALLAFKSLRAETRRSMSPTATAAVRTG
jgi:hypothetical protein